MTLDGLAKYMLALGIKEALNLDGGGSSSIYLADAERNVILNNPSDGTERSIVSGIGVFSSKVPELCSWIP
jgi:exopolysaccharide biosynthesis protein